MFTFEDQAIKPAKIKVIGVGGSGCNAVNTMIESRFTGVEFLAANTDIQALQRSKASVTIPLGTRVTKGLGAGADPEVGRAAALEDAEKIRENLAEADMVFVTAGMGGGTGTGAAPIIANISRELGSLTVGVVTKPFPFEGGKRMRRAEEGIKELRKVVDTLIVIHNQKLLSAVDKSVRMTESFRVVDDVLRQAVQGIAEVVNVPGLINVDFADVRTVMSHMGRAVMGMGFAKGEQRAVEAAQKAVSSPLLEESTIQGAKGILLNISGGEEMTLHEVNEVSMVIQEAVDPEANIILGAVINKHLKGKIVVTVIATGFEAAEAETETPMPVATGSTAAKNIDRPAFLRKVANSNVPQDRLGLTDDEWDVPAFLRKQAD
ncbi:MAG TPA: cell division protein FtsZ [Nitrospiria bacterium]